MNPKPNPTMAQMAKRRTSPGGVKYGPPRPGHKPAEDEHGWKPSGKKRRRPERQFDPNIRHA